MAVLLGEADRLFALVSRAWQALAAATTAAEVLDARDLAAFAYDAAKAAARFAKAKGAHDELIAAAHRAQADALEIEAPARERVRCRAGKGRNQSKRRAQLFHTRKAQRG